MLIDKQELHELLKDLPEILNDLTGGTSSETSSLPLPKVHFSDDGKKVRVFDSEFDICSVILTVLMLKRTYGAEWRTPEMQLHLN